MRRIRIAIATVSLLAIGLDGIAEEKCKPDHVLQAHRFIEQLKRQSPTHDGVALRDYALEDLDHDGCYEVLERINDLEEKSLGLLNTELYPATVWINVYVYRDGRYSEALRNYPEFIRARKEHYELWLRLLGHPQVFASRDSRELLKIPESKDLMVKYLRNYLGRLRKLNGR